MTDTTNTVIYDLDALPNDGKWHRVATEKQWGKKDRTGDIIIATQATQPAKEKDDE